MFFSRRHRSGNDRFLPAKVATLLVGGLLGLAGMRAGNPLLVSGAIVVVLVGFLLRFLPQLENGERPEDQRPPEH